MTTTLCSTSNGESCKVLYKHPYSFGINLKTFHFPEIVKCSQIPQSESHQPLTEQKPTTIGSIIDKHSTHIKLHHLSCGRSDGKLSNPGVTK